MVPYTADTGIQKKLLTIASLCQDFELNSIANDQKDVEMLLKANNESVLSILESSSIESISTK